MCAALSQAPQASQAPPMPLPKPPTARAAMLSADDFISQPALRRGKKSSSSRAAAEPASPPVLELSDEAGSAAALKAPVEPPALPLAAAPPAPTRRSLAPVAGPAKKPRG